MKDEDFFGRLVPLKKTEQFILKDITSVFKIEAIEVQKIKLCVIDVIKKQ